MFQNKKGMALIEMTAVVTIIALISIFAVPRFLDKQKIAEEIEVKNDIRKLEEVFTSMTDEEIISNSVYYSLSNIGDILNKNQKLKEAIEHLLIGGDIENLKILNKDYLNNNLNYSNSFIKDLKYYLVYFNEEDLQDSNNRKVFYIGADVVNANNSLVVGINS